MNYLRKLIPLQLTVLLVGLLFIGCGDGSGGDYNPDIPGSPDPSYSPSPDPDPDPTHSPTPTPTPPYNPRIPNLDPVDDDGSYDDYIPDADYKVIINGIDYRPAYVGLGYGMLGSAAIVHEGSNPIYTYVGGTGYVLDYAYYSYSDKTLTFILDDLYYADGGTGIYAGDDYRTFNNILIDNAVYTSHATRVECGIPLELSISAFNANSISYGVRVSSNINSAVQGSDMTKDIGTTLGQRNDCVLYYSIDGHQYTAKGELEKYEEDYDDSKYCGNKGYYLIFPTIKTTSPRVTIHGVCIGNKLWDYAFILKYNCGDPEFFQNELGDAKYHWMNHKAIEYNEFY